MRVGVDLDGVVYDFTGAFREYLVNEHWYDEATLPDPTLWHLNEEWGFSREDMVTYCNQAVDKGYLFWRGEPAEGAKKALEEIRENGHTIHIITARCFGEPGASEQATRRWLADHELPYDSLTFSHDKTVVRVDIMVDDKAENFSDLEATGVDAWLMDQLYNREVDTDKRVYTMLDFAARVLDLADKREKASAAPNGEVRTVSATGGEKGVKPARFDLIPARPLWTLAELYGYGAQKYADRNWEAGYDWSKSFGAMQRHAWEFWMGVDLDDPGAGGSGLPHLASVAFHAFALMEWMVTHPEFDDRPSAGAARAGVEPSASVKELHKMLSRMAGNAREQFVLLG